MQIVKSKALEDPKYAKRHGQKGIKIEINLVQIKKESVEEAGMERLECLAGAHPGLPATGKSMAQGDGYCGNRTICSVDTSGLC